ncbi:MAG: serine--tRNA ligase [Omnitrophica bacterium GWA2_52_8]|nr:MAG: serine--tRNA ligase [Omnitrophica bacterium GWA2_52_8]
MLDLKFIRENPDLVREGLAAKNNPFEIDRLLEQDADRRRLLLEVEELKSKRNKANLEIAALKKSGQADDAQAAIEAMKTISQKIKDIDEEVGKLDEEIDNLMYEIPNFPEKDVPRGPGNSANKVVRTWGTPKKHLFKAKDHLILAEALGWLSMEKGSKITGSAFPVYEAEGARLQRALISLMLDRHGRHGYREVWPPALVNRQSMTGTGQLPKFEADMYRLKDDDLFLVPTAEVPITNLFRNDVLKEEDLPVCYAGYSPCFRREAGSYGKDTKGLSRVHQFEKVEMVKVVRTEDGAAELEKLVSDAEAVLQMLELPYRVILLGSGDMSFSAAKCYDLEVWAPGTERWFEVSSCSWFRDFQARRINIRYRRKDNGKLEYAHTLNGSGVALARTVLCLLENGQTADGRVEFPQALKAYFK